MDDSTNQQNVKAPPQEQKGEYDELREIEEGKAGAILGYIPFLCFIPLIMMKDNKFAVKHGKQGLLLLLMELLAFIFRFPGLSSFFWRMILILCAIAAFIGILNSLQGKEYRIPYISDITDKFNF